MLNTRTMELFDDVVFRKGEDYFEDGRAEIEDYSRSKANGFARGTVLGGKLHEVTVQWQGLTLACRCTCPAASDGHHACKHMVAMLLQADAQGILPAEWTIGSARAAKGKKAPAKLKPPPWRAAVRNLRESLRYAGPMHAYSRSEGKALPLGTEIVYVLQPAAWAGSTPVLRPLRRSPKPDGTLDRPKKLDLSIDRISELPEVDRSLISSLAGLGSQDFHFGARVRDTYTLTPPAMRLLLPQLSAAKKLYWSGQTALPKPNEMHALRWSETPVDVELGIRKEGENAVLDCFLICGEQRYSSSDPRVHWLGAGVAVADGVGGLAHDTARAQWFERLAENGPVSFPASDVCKVLAELSDAGHLPRLTIDPALEMQVESPAPAVCVMLQKRKYGYGPDAISASVRFDYAGTIIPAGSFAQLTIDEPAHRVWLRNRDAETAAWATLRTLGFSGQDYQGNVTIPEKKVMPAVMEMIRLGWHVEGERLGRYRTAGAFNVNLTSGIDWFELQGNAQFDDKTVSLPKLLEALRKGEQYVKLDDGSLGILPQEWLTQLAPIAGSGQTTADGIRFKASQAALLDLLLQQMPQATWDEQFGRLRERLYQFSGIRPAEPPGTFVGTLREYQKEALGWFEFLRGFRFGGCLADDMGLGKTVQVLALLEQRRTTRDGEPKRPRPSLVVAPRSLVFNWKQEAARFAPQLKVLDHTGTERKNWTDQIGDHDLVLTTYGTLRKDAAQLKDIRFDYVVLDESQAIKNGVTATAKAVRLLQGDHRLALSGTPIENHLRELWSLFDFLNPGMLGSAGVFKQLTSSEDVNADMARFLGRALRPFILRRTKGQVATELPQRTEQTIYCELEGEQKKHYAQLRDHYRQALLGKIDKIGIEKTQMQVLEALLRLRQAACHPALLDKTRSDESSPKLATILDQIRDVTEEGHKALVFSQFTSFLAIVRKRLDALGISYEYLDGQTHNRQARVEAFQNNPNCRLFLISLKAGGVGLNLTAAEYVFLLDPWWNPAAEAQAIDRAHRIGQQKQVFAYRLIAKGTVEEKVIELQQRKRDLADAIINASAGPLASLTKEDLELLLT